MDSIYTFPSKDKLRLIKQKLPEYMRPNQLPFVVVGEGYLTDDQCDEILKTHRLLDHYKRSGCGATTGEYSRPLSRTLDPIITFLKRINDAYWRYKVDTEGAAWMQSYNPEDSYQLHMDNSPGQMRKLTAIALLTDSNNYEGGDLRFYVPSQYFIPSRTRGTIVVFPHWILHEVTKLTSGIRRTINLGLWGPPFI